MNKDEQRRRDMFIAAALQGLLAAQAGRAHTTLDPWEVALQVLATADAIMHTLRTTAPGVHTGGYH